MCCCSEYCFSPFGQEQSTYCLVPFIADRDISQWQVWDRVSNSTKYCSSTGCKEPAAHTHQTLWGGYHTLQNAGQEQVKGLRNQLHIPTKYYGDGIKLYQMLVRNKLRVCGANCTNLTIIMGRLSNSTKRWSGIG